MDAEQYGGPARLGGRPVPERRPRRRVRGGHRIGAGRLGDRHRRRAEDRLAGPGADPWEELDAGRGDAREHQQCGQPDPRPWRSPRTHGRQYGAAGARLLSMLVVDPTSVLAESSGWAIVALTGVTIAIPYLLRRGARPGYLERLRP